jgi:hypothetical protein
MRYRLRFPDHVNYFTPATLRGIARRAGATTNGPTDVNPTGDSLWGYSGKRGRIPRVGLFEETLQSDELREIPKVAMICRPPA